MEGDRLTQSESQIQHDIRLALGCEPDLTLYRNETGAHDAGGTSRPYLQRILRCLVRNDVPAAISLIRAQLQCRRKLIKYGLCNGSSDLIGILAPHGRLIALEVKTASGRLTTDQSMFLELVRRHGGFAAVVRSVPEAQAALARARNGATS